MFAPSPVWDIDGVVLAFLLLDGVYLPARLPPLPPAGVDPAGCFGLVNTPPMPPPGLVNTPPLPPPGLVRIPPPIATPVILPGIADAALCAVGEASGLNSMVITESSN